MLHVRKYVLVAIAALALCGGVTGCDPDASAFYTGRGGGRGAPGPIGGDGGRSLPAPPTPEPGEKIIPDGGAPTARPDGSAALPDASAGAPDAAAAAATDEAYCVEVINMYRASIGRPPLMRSMELEQSAREAAEADSQSGIPHGNFSFGGGGGASAENEIPGWPNEGGVRKVIEGGLEMMWEEGPGGGHYENMTGNYREAGCGIAITRGDQIWSAQRFR